MNKNDRLAEFRLVLCYHVQPDIPSTVKVIDRLRREPLPWAHLIPYTAYHRFYAANGCSLGEPFPTPICSWHMPNLGPVTASS